MEKILYEGPIEGAYTEVNFYDLMGQLITGQPNSRVLVKKNPDSQDETKAFIVNAWTLDDTIIIYHVKYEIKEQLMGLEDISAKVTIYGPDEKSIENTKARINDLLNLQILKKLDFSSAD